MVIMKQLPLHAAQLYILQLLQEQPRYGYEILKTSQEANRSIARSSIYHSLHYLQRRSIIASRSITAKQAPARLLYYLTPEGKHLLATYLAEHKLLLEKTIRDSARAYARILRMLESIKT